MAKATIRSKTGAVITIEGSDEEVSNIVAVFERTTAIGSLKQSVSKARTLAKDLKRRQSASDLVIDLREEGFFQKPHGLRDISSALEEKGYLFPVTTLSGVVLGLVQKRQLRRKKAGGKWVYGK